MDETPPEAAGRSVAPTIRQRYERYRARYERLRDDLSRRDVAAYQDPFVLQQWPRDRKRFADRVDQAFADWQTFGHKSQVEAASSPDQTDDQFSHPEDEDDHA